MPQARDSDADVFRRARLQAADRDGLPEGRDVPLRPEAQADRVLAAASEDNGSRLRRSAKSPACPQDFTPLVVYRTPANFLPVGWDFSFFCPSCLSYGQWIDTDRRKRTSSRPPKPTKGGAGLPRRDDSSPEAHGDGEGRQLDAEAVRRDGPDRLHRLRIRLRGLRRRARRTERRRIRTSACRAKKRRRKSSRIFSRDTGCPPRARRRGSRCRDRRRERFYTKTRIEPRAAARPSPPLPHLLVS